MKNRIKLIDKKNEDLYLIKGVFKDQKLTNTIIKNEKSNYIMCPEKKLIELFLGKKEKLNYWKLEKILKDFTSKISTSFDLQIDIDSFILNETSPKDIVQLWTESIIYALHSPYKVKNDKRWCCQNQCDVKTKIENNCNDCSSCSDCKSCKETNCLKNNNCNCTSCSSCSNCKCDNKSCSNNYHLLVSDITSELETTLNNSIVKGVSVNVTRDLQDMPPNILDSEEYVVRALELFKDKDNIKVSYLNKKEIEQLGMGLLLAVNAGSNKEARFIVIEYLGNPNSKEKIGLVGKGITFDTGGYSLKTYNFMTNMKFDMSGAAVVTGVMYGLSHLKPNINVIAVAGLTDNRIGQNATLVESVVKSLSGKYVEIGDTDAEGRLVLADGISYVVDKLKVDKVISVATLTGSCRRTLGEWMVGSFTNNQSFYNEFVNKTHTSKERIWQLPVIEEHYDVMRDSRVADLNNFPGEELAGASTAAAFLFEFANHKPIIHFDIAGTAYDNKRGKGVMVKTILEYLVN